jgi:hypothetical protein
MTEPNYEQILKNQDLISQLSLEEITNFQKLLAERKYELKLKPPEFHILNNPDNIKVSGRKVVDDEFIPRVEYIISVNQEAVRDHKVLWKQYHIDNDFKTEETVDDYMNRLIYGWIDEKFYRFYEGA